MQPNNPTNHIKLYLFILAIIIAQTIINSSTYIYVDILGILLIILLSTKTSAFYQLILISIIADLIGRWYLGTHLFSITIISIFTNRYYNFYKIINYINKNIYIIICNLLLFTIMGLIGLITNNVSLKYFDLLIELLIICPILFFITNKLFINDTETIF